MGRVIYLKKVEEFFGKTPVVSTRDVKKFVEKKNYSYLLLHNLIRTGKVKRVMKGFYSVYDDPIVAVFCFRPAYIGLQEALSFHGLWDQETATVIVTAKKVRCGIRKIFGTNVFVRRIKPEYLFGFELIDYGKFFIPISDVEKTLIDLFYFDEPIDKEVLRRIKEEIDKKRLSSYLARYPKRIKKRVRSFLTS